MRPSNQAAGQVVLVTGAGSGMGLEAALTLASRGFRIYGSVLNDREGAALSTEAQSRGVRVEALRMDVTSEREVADAISALLAQTGRIDALVSFAGLGLRGFFEDLTLDEIRSVYAVNVFGTMAVTKAVLPHMRKAGSGRIVLTTSVGGRMGTMTISGYASSKFAVEGFAECLYQEVYPFGIRVSLLEPGLVATPHFSVNRNRGRNAVNPSSPYYRWFCQHEHMVDKVLERNSFGPRDVAETVYTILQSSNPRLRYVVGRNAKLIFALRRYIPGEIFQNMYWSIVRRMVTRADGPTPLLKGSVENGQANPGASGIATRSESR